MGNASGIYQIGYCYQNGIVVEKDEHKAFIYYKKSAEMDYVSAINQVGYCYRNGIGVEKDEEMENIIGINELAKCYRNGIGVTRDIQKANYLYKREKNFATVTEVWTLKSSDIDDRLKKLMVENKYPLSWIPFNEFNNVKKIGKGGFATVYCATWLNREKNLIGDVALKLIHKSNSCIEEFIKELKAYCDIGIKNPTFLKCFGLSQHNASKDYILVMEYARMGSLHNNLYSVAQLKWKDKLTLLHCIASDLKIIHSQNLIHRDLHSGNILQNDLHSAYIADLGLSISANIKSKNNGVYGVLPYIAPEILRGEHYTKAADIYSFGIIMWEILHGKPVVFERKSEFQFNLALHICIGLRPYVFEDIASHYVDLMKECWDKEPEIRPSAEKLYDILIEWQNDKDILFELSEHDKKIQNIANRNMQIYKPSYKSKFYKNVLILCVTITLVTLNFGYLPSDYVEVRL
ncbi:kinase-like domain-containing protein [Gigaspora rosea]|uniref:Kinase-like domain-containing protein n=1 Tax=Gigaspora rosea TaxID=44941 RepID=A0A397VXH0_9GLOM|nr:kinase-like domain-containing protein [Gigaspora rosea]